MEKYLRKLYYDSPAAYTGINNLMRQIKLDGMKIKRSELKEWLKSQDAYTIHKPVRKKFPFRKVFVWTVDSLWQCDLVDMQKYKFKGYNYILTIIDVFSKYAWAIKLKHKTGSEVKDAFLLAFKNRVPNKIQFDEGKEFYNKDIKQLLDKFKIHYYSTKSDKKASVVERLALTIILGIYFTILQAYEYIEASFTIADSVFGSTFFVATGFHGLHVIIGTSFLLICFIRLIYYHFSSNHHVGFEAAA